MASDRSPRPDYRCLGAAGCRPASRWSLKALRRCARLDRCVLLGRGRIDPRTGRQNSAGKSTLIKVLTGVYQPDDGRLLYLGEPVSFSRPADAQNAGISTVYQEINLTLLSVARNVSSAANRALVSG